MAPVEAAESTPPEIRTEYPYIVRRPAILGGQPIIQGTRLPVWQIANLWNKGESVDALLEAHPDLTPAALHNALAYYWDHQEEIDAQIEANRPETVLRKLRSHPHLIEERPGTFRHKTAAELIKP
jgi:uncharacterized protein (DUF433 family)